MTEQLQDMNVDSDDDYDEYEGTFSIYDKTEEKKEEKKEETYDIHPPKLGRINYDDWTQLALTQKQSNTTDIFDIVIAKIKSTYDARWIQTLSKENQKRVIVDFIVNESKVKENNIRNPVVSQLIYNFYVKEKPVAKYLSGPHEIHHFKSDWYNKEIYLFGESHIIEGCEKYNVNNFMDVTEYLSQLFKKTDVFIDFYLEQNLSEIVNYQVIDNKNKEVKTLWNMANTFRNCLIPDKNTLLQPEYPLMRCHYSDMRKSVPKKENKKKYSAEEIYNTVKKGEKTTDSFRTRITTVGKAVVEAKHYTIGKYMTQVIEDLKEGWDVFTNRYTTELLNDESINKQVNKLVDPSIEQGIRDILKTHYTRTKTEMEIFIPSYEKEVSTQEEMVRIFTLLESLLIDFDVVAMDIYTISRIFREFNVKPGIDQPKLISNVIIYAGAFHTGIYRTFLQSLNFYEVSAKISPVTKCIDMNTIKQPLFGLKFRSM